MTYLLAISIGPVQDFIAAGRKTADLKAGSQLLVDAAKAVVDELEKNEATLIFPSSKDDEPPNKLLCRVDDNPQALVAQLREVARQTVRDQWLSMMEDKAMNRARGAIRDESIADDQLDNLLEFYAAWVQESGDYKTDRERVEKLLAGRKATREFALPISNERVPKSPLDPSRDGIFKVGAGFRLVDSALGYPLWLKPRETLDAISVLKRWKGRASDSAPSTATMAFRNIEPKLDQVKPPELDQMRNLAHDLPAGIDMGDLMFPSRTDQAMKELEEQANSLPTDQSERARTPLKDHKDHKLDLWRKNLLKSIDISGECPPYYAILVADGDRMGKHISEMSRVEEHQEFSNKIAAFAKGVEGIVSNHHGFTVYAGGDDVLALLPVNTALDCADKLRENFKATGCTMSAGIAVVHHIENLHVCLEWARKAEKAAKKERDSVAVALHTRGGEAHTVATQWGDLPTWTKCIQAFDPSKKELARGFPYELRNLAREAKDTALGSNKTVLLEEGKRIIERKEGGQSALLEDKWFNNAETLETFSKLLIIARFLAQYDQWKVK